MVCHIVLLFYIALFWRWSDERYKKRILYKTALLFLS